ncbi:hypothetical protein FA13DRAFT_1731744 [Coprinellus micaceus]|uniref:F-box domain-containing protein n=1 Tax=Coprinellus micaceus TaxID=71717 RepID=A0A4Y7TEC8_COPMI|nr:hypothetical protein FA13DRAFT_1731744 [Coprinellus micaceus]
MSHPLGIPEILRLICDRGDKKTTLSVALTCRTFLEPALDRLWHEVTSFQPLIRCLPTDLFSLADKKVLRPRRTIVEEDLKRYLTVYAHRIRTFALQLEEQKQFLSIETLGALQLATEYRLGALSPLLQHFRWPSPEEDYRCIHPESSSELLSSYIALFLGDNTQRIELEWHDHDYPLYTGSVLFHIKRRSPHLKELRLRASVTDAFVTLFLDPFPWTSLEALALEGMECTDELFLALAKMPRLRRLEIDDSHQSPQQFAARENTSFLSLDTLIIRSCDFSGPAYILQFLPTTTKLVRLKIEAGGDCGSTDCQEAIDAIRKHCNPCALQHLELYDSTYTAHGQETLDLEEDEKEDADLWELGAFSTLTTLTIRCGGRLGVLREEIGKFTETWPRLQHLDLCPMQYSRGLVPTLDHNDLLKFLQALPLLRYLGLRFDATQLGSDQGPPALGPFQLRTLRVGESPIRSPSRVVKYLKDHFPDLEELDAQYTSPISIQRPNMLDRRWAEVVKLRA